MRRSQAPSGPPEGSPDSVDLSLTGLPPPVSRRPNSASATKPFARSVSVATGSQSRRKTQEGVGPGGSRTINNLRRSNSTTQVSQAWSGALRTAEPPDFLALFESNSLEGKGLTTLGSVPSELGATWHILDDQPRELALPPTVESSGALNPSASLRRRECPVTLAPSFTANNRSNKGAVGNCVTAMVHNHCPPAEKTPPPKSSNQTAPCLNNIIKAATGEGAEGSGFGKPQKNIPNSNQVARNNTGGLPRRKEVTEEEAERFIHRVNQAAVTIQRWYRHQVQRRHAGAASLDLLLASKREVSSGPAGGGGVLELQQQKAAARRKTREEKARQARRAAIQELQQRRTQKAAEAEASPPEGPLRAGRPRPEREPSLAPRTPASQVLKTNNAGPSTCIAHPEQRGQPASSSALEPASSPGATPQVLKQLFPFLVSDTQNMASEDLEMQHPTKPKVTLDELLDTLRLLEAEPEPLPRPQAYRKEKYAWMHEEDAASSLTADNLEKLGRLSARPDDGTLLSEAKLYSILSFLDEMEPSAREQPAMGPQQEGLMLGTELASLEPPSAGTTALMRLQLEVEEKRRAMELLQRALAQQRALTARRVKEAEKELNRQLRQQKEHYEATIQRHLAFIDQLIEDKKALGEKCEAVVAELRQGDLRWKQQAEQMQTQHERELRKLKELMSATEKVRREKWVNEKTKKIKEITVKGLEPEIQKLIAQHKQEVRKLKSLHEAELLQADARASQRSERQAEELRTRLEREKEALGQRERELARQRFEQHLEQEQRALEQQRRRLYSEVAEERERLGQQAARQRSELEALKQQLEESGAAAGRALRAEFEKAAAEQERRHQVELQALKDQLEAERQIWEASYARKEEAWLLTRERELKEEIRKGRDKDIELVIQRLEADMTQAREEGERAAESRVQRLQDKFQAELQELEQSERRLQARCSELKGRLGEAEGEAGRLQGLLRQKERALEDVRTVNEQLTGERSNLAQVIRQEFADRQAASEEENQQLKAKLERVMQEKQEELEEVHRRVKLALARKEETVSALRKQHEAAVKRADHLEELLEKHRQAALTAK
ncbi:PREDICTED: 5-azacytidine-induced protein 1 [Elephantulus edwardii]|uniref:5-azacytidine-induced protein 1 n=1 Tax=Elephantulus edwardii TaxID=28737 RepID=UPI0003F0A00A|nr:PREDICTED: 5-azacytidine-induced protein 1 [Elephantulus edwardii]